MVLRSALWPSIRTAWRARVQTLAARSKEGAGKLTGDEKLKNEGVADQVKGKVQNVVGSVKDALKGK